MLVKFSRMYLQVNEARSLVSKTTGVIVPEMCLKNKFSVWDRNTQESLDWIYLSELLFEESVFTTYCTHMGLLQVLQFPVKVSNSFQDLVKYSL